MLNNVFKCDGVWKNSPFLKEINVDDADVWKTHPFDTFLDTGA